MAVELSGHLSLVTANRSDDHRELHAEIRELCNPKLDEPLSELEVESLRRVFESTRSAQKRIDQDLETNKISPERYLALLNDLLGTSARQEQQILGQKRFDCVFGDAGSHPEGLVDPKEFLSSFD